MQMINTGGQGGASPYSSTNSATHTHFSTNQQTHYSRLDQRRVSMDDVNDGNQTIAAGNQSYSSMSRPPNPNHVLVRDSNGNFSQQIGNSPDYFVVFLDPDSLIYYRMYLNNATFIKIEPVPNDEKDNKVKKRDEVTIRNIKHLLELKDFHWDFREAEAYRRRQFPAKFLQNECSKYPCYVFNSPLSKAFNSFKFITAIIDLSELVQEENFKVEVQEELVTSTSEFIKNIRREANKKIKNRRVVITEQPGHDLILKTFGLREYFEGNYQLLQYERVRLALRKKTDLKLVLTQIPKDYRSKFPPLYKQLNRGANHQLQIHQGGDQQPSPAQTPSQNAHAYTDTLGTKEFLESPPYFWYSPVPNLREMQKHHQKQIGVDPSNRNSATGAQASYTIPIPAQKKRISMTYHRSVTQGSTIPKNDESMVLQSGEFSYKFKFRLIGIERLNVLFKELANFVATENKETKPRNVQLDNPNAVNRLPDDEGRLSKMANWVKKKVGMEVNDGDKETKQKRSLHKHLVTSIQSQDAAPEPVKYEHLYSQKNNSGNLFKSFVVPGLTGGNSAADQKDEKNKKGGDKNKTAADILDKNKGKIGSGSGIENEIPNEITTVKKKYTKHATTAEREDFWEQRKKYINQYMPRLSKPFCNFADQLETIRQYKKVLRWDFGSKNQTKQKTDLTPTKLRVDCTLYHGCDPLLDESRSTRQSKEVYISQTISFNQVIEFDSLRYCQIPIKTRMAFTITLIFEENAELTIGCVSINLFDEKHQFRSGIQDLNIWPFYNIDERLGCMKEYNGMSLGDFKRHQPRSTLHMLFSKLVVSFETFIVPMIYSSRDERKIQQYKLTKTAEDEDDEKLLQEKSIDNQDLANLKKFFEQSPLEELEDIEKDDSKKNDEVRKITARQNLFKSREHYQTYPKGLPIFLKSVEWNRPVQVNEVYNMLGNWAAMEPEDAIQLLDAKYPDEKVRQYAVQRISLLSDDELRLYMLQFTQALLYEENHFSPLSEMLITRSLKNPYVVGQAFFWSLKANLYIKPSYERYTVLLEQLLMISGSFLNELLIQSQINKGLQSVSECVTAKKEKMKHDSSITMDDIIRRARIQLAVVSEYMPPLFTVAIDPKFVGNEFLVKKLGVFSSAKSPLRVVVTNNDRGGDKLQMMFKNGDDLRQDILTLQMIDIMDRIWLDNNLDLAMTPYKVLGTDCMQGYLEFNLNCTTLADIQHKGSSIMHTFSDTSVHDFFVKTIIKELCSDHSLLKSDVKLNEDKIREFKKFERIEPIEAMKDQGNLEATIFFNAFTKNLEAKRKVFIRSTAGYCVASYVLGLGDRHPDNIMINFREGNFLHIDFGHFLENKKKMPILKISREQDPFVFTPEVAYFINGKSFKESSKQLKMAKKKKRQDAAAEQSNANDDAATNRPLTQEEYKTLLSFINTAENSEQAKSKIEMEANATGEASNLNIEKNKTENFLLFETYCCQAYNDLRHNSNKMINLFLIMLSAGMPELQQKEEIGNFQLKLNLKSSDREAEKIFIREIKTAMTTFSRRMDNAAHNYKQLAMSKKNAKANARKRMLEEEKKRQ